MVEVAIWLGLTGLPGRLTGTARIALMTRPESRKLAP
jgi:hypothetical protein